MTMRYPALLALCLVVLAAFSLPAEERTQRFDRDPGWDGQNNRVTKIKPVEVKQDFGYRKPGEIGGLLTSAAEPAYYAKKIAPATFDDTLSASGTVACSGRRSHFLIAFFNAGTLNEWRTPNTIGLRLSCRGDVIIVWLEYCTSKWRAGGDSPKSFPMERDPMTKRMRLVGFPAKGKTYRWSLRYDPKGNRGNGVVTATFGDAKAECWLGDGHKLDGATFNRFGLLNVMKHGGDPGD